MNSRRLFQKDIAERLSFINKEVLRNLKRAVASLKPGEHPFAIYLSREHRHLLKRPKPKRPKR